MVKQSGRHSLQNSDQKSGRKSGSGGDFVHRRYQEKTKTKKCKNPELGGVVSGPAHPSRRIVQHFSKLFLGFSQVFYVIYQVFLANLLGKHNKLLRKPTKNHGKTNKNARLFTDRGVTVQQFWVGFLTRFLTRFAKNLSGTYISKIFQIST